MYTADVPEYVIDLTKPEDERWAQVITHERRAAKRLGKQALKEVTDAVEDRWGWVPTMVRNAVTSLARPLYAMSGGMYVEEIDAWSEALDIEPAHGVLMNCTYELSMMCTAGVAPSPRGPVHVRSMDWPLSGIGRATCVFRFKRRAHEFVAVGIAGHVGVLSGMVPGGYSITMNYAPSDGVGYGYGPSFYLRHVFETCKTYAQAVRALTDADLAVAAFFVVCGTRSGEACVVERTRKASVVRETKSSVLSQANHHETEEFEYRNAALADFDPETEEMSVLAYSKLRAQALRQALGQRRPTASVREIAAALDAEPVCNDESYQQMVFQPATGEYHVWRWT